MCMCGFSFVISLGSSEKGCLEVFSFDLRFWVSSVIRIYRGFHFLFSSCMLYWFLFIFVLVLVTVLKNGSGSQASKMFFLKSTRN